MIEATIGGSISCLERGGALQDIEGLVLEVVNVRRRASSRRSQSLNDETASVRFRARNQKGYPVARPPIHRACSCWHILDLILISVALIAFVVVVLLASDDAPCDNDDVLLESEAEEVFDRRVAVTLYRSFADEHGVVNLTESYWQTSCDGFFILANSCRGVAVTCWGGALRSRLSHAVTQPRKEGVTWGLKF